MKEIQLCVLILLSLKSAWTANPTRKIEDGNTLKDFRRKHWSSASRITKAGAILAENETLVTVSSNASSDADVEFDDSALENQFQEPNDRTSDNPSSNDSLIFPLTSTETTATTTTTEPPPVNAPLVRNNTVVPLGGRCNFASKCAGENVDCHLGICACISGYEDHQGVCLQSGGYARLREACNATYKCMGQFTQCRSNTCTCIDGYFNNYDKFNSCVERTMNHVIDVPKTDPTMIGVVVGLALMSVTLCVVMRLFAKARFRENRTIFNTANPRLMNVTLKKGSKHTTSNRGRRGSQTSVQSGEYAEAGFPQNERYADTAGSVIPTREEPSGQGQTA